MSACAVCSSPISGSLTCPRCGSWDLNAGVGGLSGTIQESDLIDATKVSAAKITRIVTNTPFDRVWGPPNDPGFVPGTTSVLTGLPGSGKSTLCLQLTPIFAKLTGRVGYYVSGEQEGSELAYTLARLKITLEPGQLRLVNSMRSSGRIDESVLTKCPPGLIIVDSISTLAGAKAFDSQAALARAYKPIAVKFNCVVLMISQQNKQGTTLGVQAIQHDVDSVIDVDTMEKDYRRRNRVLRDHCLDGDPDLRALVPYKNRYGPTFEYVYVIMGPHGLEPLPPPPKGTIRKSGDALADAVIDLDELDEEEEMLRGRLQEIKTERGERKGKVARIAAAKQRGATVVQLREQLKPKKAKPAAREAT